MGTEFSVRRPRCTVGLLVAGVALACGSEPREPADTAWAVPDRAPPASGPLTRREALWYTRAYFHGFDSFDSATRARMLRDTAALALYADLLTGRAPWPRGAWPNTTLLWLVEARDPRHVPVFLQLTDSAAAARVADVGPTADEGSFNNAAVGLAQQLDVPAARERLRALLSSLEECDIVAAGMIGDPDPFIATMSAVGYFFISEIVISTLPDHRSAWMEGGLIDKIKRQTGKPVIHVESSDASARAGAAAGS